jgi:hypothetical protein
MQGVMHVMTHENAWEIHVTYVSDVRYAGVLCVGANPKVKTRR